MPLVEEGAARAFGFTDAEIALACSSHNGEPVHVETARSMLAKAGLTEDYLECGPQPPARDEDRFALREAGIAPGRIHNNCSGKHAGMLAVACFMGVDPRGYSGANHPVQQRVRQVMEEMAGVPLTADHRGIDGCSIPTWAAPLDSWAVSFAKVASGRGVDAGRAEALAHLRSAATNHPFMIAGTGRFCTILMDRLGASAFVKTGAEGVYCAAFPGPGFGIALKVDDGGTRAAECLMAAATAECAGLSADQSAALSDLVQPSVKNRVGIVVGDIRVAAEARAGLATIPGRP